MYVQFTSCVCGEVTEVIKYNQWKQKKTKNHWISFRKSILPESGPSIKLLNEWDDLISRVFWCSDGMGIKKRYWGKKCEEML